VVVGQGYSINGVTGWIKLNNWAGIIWHYI
jgi:hypothetical protein